MLKQSLILISLHVGFFFLYIFTQHGKKTISFVFHAGNVGFKAHMIIE